MFAQVHNQMHAYLSKHHEVSSSKMGGRLIDGIDLYKGKYGNDMN
mgnify:CR=1 FL=1